MTDTTNLNFVSNETEDIGPIETRSEAERGAEAYQANAAEYANRQKPHLFANLFLNVANTTGGRLSKEDKAYATKMGQTTPEQWSSDIKALGGAGVSTGTISNNKKVLAKMLSLPKYDAYKGLAFYPIGTFTKDDSDKYVFVETLDAFIDRFMSEMFDNNTSEAADEHKRLMKMCGLVAVKVVTSRGKTSPDAITTPVATTDQAADPITIGITPETATPAVTGAISPKDAEQNNMAPRTHSAESVNGPVTVFHTHLPATLNDLDKVLTLSAKALPELDDADVEYASSVLDQLNTARAALDQLIRTVEDKVLALQIADDEPTEAELLNSTVS